MPKNIVVCCDGTANEFAQDKTNVVKLFSTLHHDPIRQVTYYHPGLGTMEPAGALTTFTRKWTKLLGKAAGYGLPADIRDAYVFLMNHYESGDKVFLFGFSRGAYTVRAVAAMLHMYGLIRPGNEPLVPYAIRMLSSVSRTTQAAKTGAQGAVFELASDFKGTFCSTECMPWFVGVWDTVSSVGWVENPLKIPFTATNPDIQIGRHAISIDERRAFFRTNLWRPSSTEALAGPKDLKQVWFPGVHCDVGGGYPESESGLSKIALEWMLREARAAGLLVSDAEQAKILGETGGAGYVPPNPAAPRHESLKNAWRIAEFIPKRHYNWKTGRSERRMNLFRRRTIPAGALIHDSAFQRGDVYIGKLQLPTEYVRVKTEPEPRSEDPLHFSQGSPG
jgi:uncharacterized protein (DUF2235 family)